MLPIKQKDYEVLISLQQKTENEIELKIGDNGSGFDFKELIAKHTLGLELIKDLADSLDMTAQFPSKNNCIIILILRSESHHFSKRQGA